eukprot:COSAG01_NODE_1671_length_9555_cov_12.742597_6_plen_73_part_00
MGDEMEGILLLSLKQAGVSLADGIDSLRDISVDMLINAAVTTCPPPRSLAHFLARHHAVLRGRSSVAAPVWF